jgi:hypothetical protein
MSSKHKPLSFKELTNQYEVSPYTMREWLKPFEEEIGPRIGGKYTVKQIRIIYKRLDNPPGFEGE